MLIAYRLTWQGECQNVVLRQWTDHWVWIDVVEVGIIGQDLQYIRHFKTWQELKNIGRMTGLS